MQYTGVHIRAVAIALRAMAGWAIQVVPRPCAPSRQLVFKDSWREQSSGVFKGPWSSHAWLVPCWRGVGDPHAGRCGFAHHAPASLGGCPSSLHAHPPVPLRGPHACVAKELALMHAQCLHAPWACERCAHAPLALWHDLRAHAWPCCVAMLFSLRQLHLVRVCVCVRVVQVGKA